MAAVFAVLVVLVSCVNEPTAPRDGARYASGLRFNAIFPALLQMSGAADLVPFDRVHVLLHHSDGTVALDTTIVFPADKDTVALDLTVRLLPGTPVTGEIMTLDLAYLNAAGQVVFRGGPVSITAIPTLPGQSPAPPVTIPVVYVGAGANAAFVRIAPRTLSVAAGAPFTFTASALDSSGTPIAGTPIYWTSLDPTRATITSPALGVGTALATRGTARIVAALINGKADTVVLSVQAVAAAIAALSGSGQTGIVGKPLPTVLPQPLIVKVTAADGLPVAGTVVTFAVASGGGSVSAATATTDTLGLAQTTWTLGGTVGSQTVTATAGSLAGSPVTFSATATAVQATTLAFTSVPAAGANITAGAATSVTVTARDVDGSPVAAFTGSVTISLGTNPTGATLSGTLTVAAVAGVATFPDLSITTPGTGYVLAAASTGLTGAVSPAFNVVSNGGVYQTVVTPNPDTLTAIGLTQQLTAQGFDPNRGNVAGSWTWVSRSPAIATVTATGLVTSVTNGSTYVVATEAGGSRDSSLTVVQQRVASVNVTPGSRSLYPGGLFTFTAQAVDGNGVAMATQPTVTWTSSAPSVASINASTGQLTALTIGSAQVRATAGTTVGVSSLSVLTPITRIDVSYDSALAPAPDVFTLPALGSGRAYRAVAHDTIGNVMTGVTFSWNSTNSSVALIDTAQATRAHALATANGVTAIQASAQGVTGAASLTVSQVLTAIDLQPPTAIVAITGSTSLVARGKDANGRFISGGSFTFTSSAPSVATVNPSSGVVTGVANGTTNIVAQIGGITSNTISITVNNSGPAVISFGRDTLGIGRGSSLSVPILLSKPSASAVTVNLAVADTFAFWSAASVTIPANATSANATLNGHNAGTTRITAIDPTGAYLGDTAVLNVQATLRLASGGYSVNAADQVATQVLLSDPSPPGGTYVPFSYGTAGIASVSPDPAFIPEGQLAANLVISGLTAGSTTVTPVASGVAGTASTVTVSAANLNMPYASIVLGSGQFDPNQYVQVPNYMNTPLAITLRSSDTTVAVAPPSVTIGTGAYYTYFNVTARARGTASIFATANGWRPDTLVVISTTPRLTISGGATLNVTSPVQSTYAYTTDSLRSAHARFNSLAIAVSSSDTTVLKVVDTLVTVAAGQYYTSNIRFAPGGKGGTAYLKVSASGHVSDSTLYTVVGPALSLSWTSSTLGQGQEEPNAYVQIPNAISTPLTVTVTSSDSTIVAPPQTVVIPAGSYYQYFTMRGKAPGTATIIASTAGYAPDTATTKVTTPRVRLSGGNTIPAYSTSSIYAYTADSVQTYHNRTADLAVRFRSSDTTILKVDSLETIAAGTYYTSVPATVTAVNPGTVWLYATAPGHFADSVQWTVQPAKLNLSFTTYVIGARQTSQATDFNVQIPGPRSTAVAITLTQKQPSRVQLASTTVTIPANQYYQYFGLAGLATGTDTIIATAPGYLPDTGFVRVSTPRLNTGGLGSTYSTTAPPQTLTVYAADSINQAHYVLDTITVHAVSSNDAVMTPDSAYFHIPKGVYYAQPKVIFTGVGSASITYSDSAGSGYLPVTTNTVTLTGPALSIAGGNGMLGMRQQTSPNQYYVYTPNPVGTPLTVNLVSTSTRVVSVPATVTIPANSYYGYFTVTALDTIGTIQVQASASGYSPTSVNMQVTKPKFVISGGPTLNQTSAPYGFYVYAADAQGTSHLTAENVIVTLTSSAPGVVSIDSATVTIPAGQYYSSAAKWIPGSVGTAVTTASDARAAYYQYDPATTTVTVQTPAASLSFSNLSLAVGQYSDEYASIPDARTTSALTVPLTHAATPHTSTPSSVTIALNTNYQTFRISGSSLGADTITASPAGHVAARAAVTVALGRLDPAGWPTTSLKAGDSTLVTLYARDANSAVRYLLSATTFTLTPNANIQFVSGGANSAVMTSAVIPADTYYVQFYLKAVSSGTGSATISNVNYTSYTNSVTVTP